MSPFCFLHLIVDGIEGVYQCLDFAMVTTQQASYLLTRCFFDSTCRGLGLLTAS